VGNRGRPSAASILSEAKLIEATERPRPPHDLNDEEVEVWVKVAGAQVPDWFNDANLPLLAQYCRHSVHARRIGELIEKASGDPDLAVRDYNRLLIMQSRETRTMMLLATKMRIAQQSVKNQRGNKKNVSAKPWEG
jgi:hypothetical protein